jgi:hypothetical protein
MLQLIKKQVMKHLIVIFHIVISPLIGITQQNDSLIYCDYPDTEAKPPFRFKELLLVLLNNENKEMPDCFNPIAQFYINVIIQEDGSVVLLNLECVTENESCYITVNDLSKLEKWIPATLNGKTCTQKMRMKTYIHFE